MLNMEEIRARHEAFPDDRSQVVSDRYILLRALDAMAREVLALREVLQKTEEAINPRDRKMLSMAVWQDRLKAATDDIFTALQEPNPWMPDGSIIPTERPADLKGNPDE